MILLPTGAVFFGAALQWGTQFTSRPFGEYAMGFGVGETERYGSLATTLSFGGLDEVIRDGNLNLQFSRAFGKGIFFGIGLENLLPWGADKRLPVNAYVVLTHQMVFIYDEDYSIPWIASIGIGNNRFVHQYETHKNESHVIRPFFSTAFGIIPEAALILDWVGRTFNVGISIVPFLDQPFLVNISALDLSHQGGRRIPIAVSIGYAYIFS